MLCIWWDQKDLVYYELLKPGDSITSDRYRLQLIRLSRALREKWSKYEQRHDKVILLHDNTRPHVANIVKKYLKTLKWDVLPHPPYSPTFLLLLISGCSEECSKSPVHFFRRNRKLAPKLDRLHFFRDEIWKLPERWEKIVGSDGQYFNWSVHSFCFEINAQKNRSN